MIHFGCYLSQWDVRQPWLNNNFMPVEVIFVATYISCSVNNETEITVTGAK